MKVKDLLAKLAMVDQELEIATLIDDHEYWGKVYGYAERAEVGMVSADGPKKADTLCFVIE